MKAVNKITLVRLALLVGFPIIGVFFSSYAPAQQGQTNRLDYGQLEDESSKFQKGSYEESLYKITIDTFEREAEWRVSMPIDYGFPRLKEIPGAPLGLTNAGTTTVQGPPSQVEGDGQRGTYFESEEDPKKQVLGLKVSFMSRKPGWVRIDPPQPTRLVGLVKGFEIWATGRDLKHKLYIIIKDVYGKEQLVEMGMLNYTGWRKLTAPVPFNIIQEDFRFSPVRGLSFEGILIAFDMTESIGNYFIYFDNLAVELSRYIEENMDRDLPKNNW